MQTQRNTRSHSDNTPPASGRDPLPTAVLRRGGAHSSAPGRLWRRPVNAAQIVHGAILGPLVAYLLLGTALLYAVYTVESVAGWLANRGYPTVLCGVRPRRWHDSRMSLVVGFPLASTESDLQDRSGNCGGRSWADDDLAAAIRGLISNAEALRAAFEAQHPTAPAGVDSDTKPP